MTKKWLCIALLPALGTIAWAGQVTGLTLIDAATDQPICPLNNGAVIDLSTTDRGINVRADVAGDVRSVRFGLNDKANFKTESVAPFALRGDNRGNYSEWAPASGEYTITATPYPQPNAGGTPGTPLRVTFRVKGKPGSGPIEPPEVPSQYPDIASEQDLGPVSPPVGGTAEPSGELKRWHCVTLTFDGPQSSETARPNPFLHYRLDVTFVNDSTALVVPGYYAGDGQGGVEGNKWRVHFSPPEAGAWTWFASFRAGFNVNISTNPQAGRPTACDGATGSFGVLESDKVSPDFRAPGNGLLVNRGHHYLTFGGSGRPWIKGGPDIPENLLGYVGFENTPNAGHSFVAHIADWRPGDPDWGDGQGKAIIGAFNYIAANGGNSVYFLPMNIGGDGKDTFPTIGPYEKTRYDNSKLLQWEIVFQHAQSLGVFLHFQLAETEQANENYHDDGALGSERKLYYRELIARFGHHNGIEFNLGEENDYGTQRRVEFARFIKTIDPYDHPVSAHTHGGKEESTYDPFIDKLRAGEEVGIDMTSFQGGKSRKAMSTLMERFRRLSAEVAHPWVMSYDEPQTIHNDKTDEQRGYAMARRFKMWPAYMGGGGGFEWYVQQDGGGHSFDHRIENFADMDLALRWCGYARDFLYHLPLLETEPNHDLAQAARGETYVLAKVGNAYAIYNDTCGEGFRLDLLNAPGTFHVRWFDPRNGGPLRQSNITTIAGGAIRSLGNAPSDLDKDWACLVQRRGN